MKRLFLIIFTLPLFVGLTCDKEIPTKLYYLDTNYVSTWSFDKSSDADTAIFLRTYLEGFNFKGNKKEYSIYFDKKFTLLAVKNELIKENKQEHYQRFDRNGTLRMEYNKVDGKYIGLFRTWYGNKSLEQIEYYDNNGNITGDTIFDRNKNIKNIYLHFNGLLYKDFSFYTNGQISEEAFYVNDGMAKDIFITKYDSLSRKPSMFFIQDTTIAQITPYGEEIVTKVFKFIPADSAEIKRKK